jgi:hypothetical protein
LDAWDGFSISVDGGPAITYSFGNQGGHPTKIEKPITGKIFTFGYPHRMSIEDYYVGAIGYSCATPPDQDRDIPKL